MEKSPRTLGYYVTPMPTRRRRRRLRHRVLLVVGCVFGLAVVYFLVVLFVLTSGLFNLTA